MGEWVRRRSPYFRDYYRERRERGKSYTKAVSATSTKLLMVIYALLTANRLIQEQPPKHKSKG